MNSKFLFLNDIIKYAILYAVNSNGNKCSAKQIQDILGLKKQTTYNYLKELLDSGELMVSYETHETRTHINVAYYWIPNPVKFLEFREIEQLSNLNPAQRKNNKEKLNPHKLKQEFQRYSLLKIAKNLIFTQYLKSIDEQQFLDEILQSPEKLPSKHDLARI